MKTLAAANAAARDEFTLVNFREYKVSAANTATFDANGTRFELVLTPDPNGGVLVIWPAGRWFGRVHQNDDHIAALGGKLRKDDEVALRSYLKAAKGLLPWTTP